MQHVDFIIKNAKVFNRGERPVTEDVAISAGKIVARGQGITTTDNTQVIDAHGMWLMPGLFDIHTHYDLELEVAPELPESTRHGTTTVVIANCSLGLAYGAQRRDGHDPIVSCYARVENIPKSVLRAVADKVNWSTPREYLSHLTSLNLGPNVVTMMPHSMLRIEAMGFEASISREPSHSELATMRNQLKDALDAGYVGFSTDALPFHYLANQPYTERTIPTQFAKYEELKALTQVVREANAIWQATPPKDSVIGTLKTMLLTSGLLHGKPLKTTVVAAMKISNNWKLLGMVKVLAYLLNSALLKGNFHMQALGARFKTWSDGAITPLAEEIPELRRLNETDLEDREGRQKIMADPAFVAAFKAMWMKGKKGMGIDRLKRLISLEDYAFHRDMAKMTVERCPMKHWEGWTFDAVYQRVQAIKAGQISAQNKTEAKLVATDFASVKDEGDFMLQMLRSFDTKLSWSTVTANDDLRTVRELLMEPMFIPGFNDSGAHLT
ncbi:MAG TPA: amidohydrolase family protein, partial [Pseudomonadales bacterium]|nr:amidohydrolase family protein [Pseudomonadales bacterium]